jgi:hypothetical protein
VIFMSGYTDSAALETARIGSGAIPLSKPFSTELLARRISEVQQNAADANSKCLAARNAGLCVRAQDHPLAATQSRLLF